MKKIEGENTLDFKLLSDVSWWFFYFDLEDDNSYAVKKIGDSTFLLFDIDETVNKEFIATNKDEILEIVFKYFKENNIEIISCLQEEG